MNNNQLFCQYCDDVRREKDGRVSLMGIFPGETQIPKDLPYVIPKICAQAVLLVSKKAPLSSVAVKLIWEGKEIRKLTLPVEAIDDLNTKQSQDGPDDDGVFVISFLFEVANFEIKHPGAIRVAAVIGDEVLEGLPLHVRPTLPKKTASSKRQPNHLSTGGQSVVNT